jgi:hypothetical protein
MTQIQEKNAQNAQKISACKVLHNAAFNQKVFCHKKQKVVLINFDKYSSLITKLFFFAVLVEHFEGLFSFSYYGPKHCDIQYIRIFEYRTKGKACPTHPPHLISLYNCESVFSHFSFRITGQRSARSIHL